MLSAAMMGHMVMDLFNVGSRKILQKEIRLKLCFIFILC
jgi:hypothetical protein